MSKVETLTEFLLARIAEDEGLARAVGRAGMSSFVTPARVLAECEAKRRIVKAHVAERLTDAGESPEVWSDCADCWQAPPCHTLRLLALPYADHPDYRDEWRP